MLKEASLIGLYGCDFYRILQNCISLSNRTEWMKMKDNELKADERLAALLKWLNLYFLEKPFTFELASGDASFRRYFRIFQEEQSFIVMDAPPGKEDCRPFVKIATAMQRLDLNVPEVLASDIEDGFLLLTDFGDEQYLDVLDAGNVDALYNDAFRALLKLQKAAVPADLPAYDYDLLISEMCLFGDCLLGDYLSISGADDLEETFELLAQSAMQQPAVWVHRDFHSRNLMRTHQANPAILDFQDAVCGPVTYDVVSLLKDCYISWPDERVNHWLRSYYEMLLEQRIVDVDFDVFRRWFDLMGIQRHLKAAGIFARLNCRDGKPTYLKDIPCTLKYIHDASCRYPELENLAILLRKKIMPAMNAALSSF